MSKTLLSRLTDMIGRDGDAVPATMALGAALLDASLPKPAVDRLFRKGPFGLVIVAPSEGHLDIAFETLDYVVPNGNVVIGLSEPGDARDAETLVSGIAAQRVCVVVVTDVGHAPKSFRSLGDLTIHLAMHDAGAIRATMRTALGKPAPAFPDAFTPNPDPLLLCRCILPGIAVERVADAIVKLSPPAMAIDEVLPAFEDCIEYGPAHRWGMQVMRDFASWRQGSLAAGDLDATCLLVSPPGYGKTRFAKLLADSMGVPFVRLTAGSLFKGEGHLGDVVRHLADVFGSARAATPAVLLIDEIDSFARRSAHNGNTYFADTVINELLTLVDAAVSECPGLVIIGATNIPQAVEPALLRPGRLSRTIKVPLPDAEGLEHILRVHLREQLVDQPLHDVVRSAHGSTPAELMDAVRRAKQHARSKGRPIRVDDLTSAFPTKEPEDTALIGRVATHEAGHALACLMLPDAPRLESISLDRNGSLLGRVSSSPPPGPVTLKRIEARVMVILAGRAAENVIYGKDDPSDGASADLAEATALICQIHTQLGMTGSLAHYRDPEERLVRDIGFAATVEEHLQRMFSQVTDLLERYRFHVMALASELVIARRFTGEEAVMIVETANEIEQQGLAAPDRTGDRNGTTETGRTVN